VAESGFAETTESFLTSVVFTFEVVSTVDFASSALLLQENKISAIAQIDKVIFLML
jgi:hypothetical protein